MKLPTLLLSLAILPFTQAAAAAKAPGGWTCDDGLYEDGICDCGCGDDDADCKLSTFEGCERSACAEGKVPWEHAPSSCMSSACGDGWLDPSRGEVCDDGEALAGGGCAADCGAVNEGWACGERAQKCEPAVVEEGPEDTGDTGAEGEEVGTSDAGTSDSDVIDVTLADAGGDTAGSPSVTSPAPEDTGCRGGVGSGCVALLVLPLAFRRRGLSRS